ncbi:MAG: hypothetical protein B7Z37_08380 [Verrucomicrobia bacterium 12-59-8]|nr:MAG: hypothetical protein B7Z37_08380 [Verrucomicrobia bacterium 12-59-8]
MKSLPKSRLPVRPNAVPAPMTSAPRRPWKTAKKKAISDPGNRAILFAMTANPPITIESFLEVSEQLPIDDQYELLNRLSDRLHGGCGEDESEVTLSPEWMEEINRRIAEVESGTAELIPAEQVLAELRAQVRTES